MRADGRVCSRRAQIELHTRPGALRVAVVTEAAEALPAAELAWRHDVVLTTFSYLSCAWAGARAAAGGGGGGAGPRAARAPARASPLVHVHWLRLILDEGHMLGASLQLTNKLQAGPRAALRRAHRWCGVAAQACLCCPAQGTPVAHLSAARQPSVLLRRAGLCASLARLCHHGRRSLCARRRACIDKCRAGRSTARARADGRRAAGRAPLGHERYADAVGRR
jgi:hypothetical protein